MAYTTLIRVSKETHEKLKAKGTAGDSMDKVISDLLDKVEDLEKGS